MQKKENIFRDNECHLLLEPEEKKKNTTKLKQRPSQHCRQKMTSEEEKKTVCVTVSFANQIVRTSFNLVVRFDKVFSI